MERELVQKNISPESKLVLLVIEHTITGDKNKEIEELISSYEINWKKFRELITYHELIPFAYLAFKERYFLFPSDLMQMFKNTYYYTLMRNQRMWQEFLRISDAFKGKDIILLPIKGIAFLEDIYAQYPVRQMVDIDVLVKEEDLGKAKDLFYDLGYSQDLGGLKEEYWL